MIITLPLRLIILHFSQMGLTDGLTFILIYLLVGWLFSFWRAK
jgi:hypothetical protein